MITIGGMLRCAERELALRRRVYPQWVASNRMSQANADREIEMMAAIVEHLRAELPPAEPPEHPSLL